MITEQTELQIMERARKVLPSVRKITNASSIDVAIVLNNELLRPTTIGEKSTFYRCTFSKVYNDTFSSDSTQQAGLLPAFGWKLMLIQECKI